MGKKEERLLLTARTGQSFSLRKLLATGLFKKRVDVNATDKDGKTPLILAATNDHFSIVKSLIEAGADLNMKDKEGRTALDCAKGKGLENILELLKEKGTKE